ncbi:hypothetical protein ACUXV3_12045 [Roseobacteraceae bacterium NS-SX3]
MKPLCDAARAWSVSRDPVDFALFKFACAELFESIGTSGSEPVLLASEDLAGHMPGRHGLTDYSAAPALMQGIEETVLALHPEARIHFFFSTREAGPWLRSCHVQHLRASPMTLNEADYLAEYAASSDLERIITETAQAASRSTVSAAPLEASAGSRLGPLSSLLPLLGLPGKTEAALKPVPPENARPAPEILAALLALNRSGRPYPQVHKEKQELLAGKRALPGISI